MTKQALTAADSPVYQLADSLTDEQLKAELDVALAVKNGAYADTVRKALGRATKRALTTTQYGAKLEVARAILKRKAREANATAIVEAVRSLGGLYASLHNLKQMGFSKREVEAAVGRGDLVWRRDGKVEVA